MSGTTARRTGRGWGRVAAGTFVLAGGFSGAAQAEPAGGEKASELPPRDRAPSSWDPGRRTTASLPGEVSGATEAAHGDGVYGRFAGDLELALLVGAELDTFAPNRRVAGKLSALYFGTAGIYGSYRHDPVSDHDTRQLLAAGLEIKPVFIARWSQNLEDGPSFADLLLDSPSLTAGVVWALDPERSDRRGFETSVGIGIPLSSRASGPWLEARGQLRWFGTARAEPSVFIGLAWHLWLETPLSHATGDVN